MHAENLIESAALMAAHCRTQQTVGLHAAMAVSAGLEIEEAPEQGLVMASCLSVLIRSLAELEKRVSLCATDEMLAEDALSKKDAFER